MQGKATAPKIAGAVIEMTNDKMKLSGLLPVRDFPLAASVAVFGMALLWASGHPPEEWPAVVAAFYIGFRLGLALVMGALGYAAKLLAGYGRRVLRRHGVELPPDAPGRSASRQGRVLLIAASIVLTAFPLSAAIGIAASGLAIGWLEITPLAPAFHWAAWGLLGCGLACLLLLLGAPALVFLAADARIRIRVSEARLTAALSLLPEIQAGIPAARGK